MTYLVRVKTREVILSISAVCLLGGLGGCLERTIRVTSDPPGALVWLNDVEIGRTPAEARFKFYGTYDVRLELAGYEPVHEGREAVAPLHEYPGPDVIASAWPGRIRNTVEWHFELEASPVSLDPGAEAEMVERARALRERLGPAPIAIGEPGEEPGTPGPPAPVDAPSEDPPGSGGGSGSGGSPPPPPAP